MFSLGGGVDCKVRECLGIVPYRDSIASFFMFWLVLLTLKHPGVGVQHAFRLKCIYFGSYCSVLIGAGIRMPRSTMQRHGYIYKSSIVYSILANIRKLHCLCQL